MLEQTCSKKRGMQQYLANFLQVSQVFQTAMIHFVKTTTWSLLGGVSSFCYKLTWRSDFYTLQGANIANDLQPKSHHLKKWWESNQTTSSWFGSIKKINHCFFLRLPSKSWVNCVFFVPPCFVENTHENIGPLSTFSEGKITLNLAMGSQLVAGFLPGVAHKVSWNNHPLGFASSLLGRSSKKIFFPKWWWKMVMNPMGSESLKNHQKKQLHLSPTLQRMVEPGRLRDQENSLVVSLARPAWTNNNKLEEKGPVCVFLGVSFRCTFLFFVKGHCDWYILRWVSLAKEVL